MKVGTVFCKCITKFSIDNHATISIQHRLWATQHRDHRKAQRGDYLRSRRQNLIQILAEETQRTEAAAQSGLLQGVVRHRDIDGQKQLAGIAGAHQLPFALFQQPDTVLAAHHNRP